LEQTKILLVGTVLGVWIFLKLKGQQVSHRATRINRSLSLFSNAKGESPVERTLKEVQILSLASDKIPNHTGKKKE
jgi:hypothetical protein